MWLILTSASPPSLTLQKLCDETLPAVVAELEAANYTIAPLHRVKHPIPGGGWLHTGTIEPGSANLTVTAKWGNTIEVLLTGPKFRGDYTDNRDAPLWDSLEALRQRLVATYLLEDISLGDPGFATGESGAPGTEWPDLPGMPEGRPVEDDEQT